MQKEGGDGRDAICLYGRSHGVSMSRGGDVRRNRYPKKRKLEGFHCSGRELKLQDVLLYRPCIVHGHLGHGCTSCILWVVAVEDANALEAEGGDEEKVGQDGEREGDGK